MWDGRTHFVENRGDGGWDLEGVLDHPVIVRTRVGLLFTEEEMKRKHEVVAGGRGPGGTRSRH